MKTSYVHVSALESLVGMMFAESGANELRQEQLLQYMRKFAMDFSCDPAEDRSENALRQRCLDYLKELVDNARETMSGQIRHLDDSYRIQVQQLDAECEAGITVLRASAAERRNKIQNRMDELHVLYNEAAGNDDERMRIRFEEQALQRERRSIHMWLSAETAQRIADKVQRKINIIKMRRDGIAGISAQRRELRARNLAIREEIAEAGAEDLARILESLKGMMPRVDGTANDEEGKKD